MEINIFSLRNCISSRCEIIVLLKKKGAWLTSMMMLIPYLTAALLQESKHHLWPQTFFATYKRFLVLSPKRPSHRCGKIDDRSMTECRNLPAVDAHLLTARLLYDWASTSPSNRLPSADCLIALWRSIKTFQQSTPNCWPPDSSMTERQNVPAIDAHLLPARSL